MVTKLRHRDTALIRARYAVIRVDNAVPYHRTGYDRHDVHIFYERQNKRGKKKQKTKKQTEKEKEEEKWSYLPSGDRCGNTLEKNEQRGKETAPPRAANWCSWFERGLHLSSLFFLRLILCDFYYISFSSFLLLTSLMKGVVWRGWMTSLLWWFRVV